MRFLNGVAQLEEVVGIGVDGDLGTVTEINGTKVRIPLSVVLRVYEVAKHECECRGDNWEVECWRIVSLSKGTRTGQEGSKSLSVAG